MMQIPYGRQDISEEDIAAVGAVLRSDWLTQGPAVPAFESAVSKHCGAQHAVAVNSGTSALHVACLALGVGPGDWVWTSAITFVASANCALYCGARVDLVDIDPRTYNLSVESLTRKLEHAEKTGTLPKVVIPVHLCGQPCDMARISALSKRYGFKIIDDMIDGLANWMDEKGYARIDDFRGKAVANVTDWQFLNMNFKTIAHIDQDLCITCGLCHIACEDTSHQSIAAERVDGRRRYRIIDEECVGCNLCQHVCPVPNCITMVPVETGKPYLNWTQHPNNPMREAAE